MAEHTWQLYAAWDEALLHARLHAARTGIRHRVRRGRKFRGLWVVEEATA